MGPGCRGVPFGHLLCSRISCECFANNQTPRNTLKTLRGLVLRSRKASSGWALGGCKHLQSRARIYLTTHLKVREGWRVVSPPPAANTTPLTWRPQSFYVEQEEVLLLSLKGLTGNTCFTPVREVHSRARLGSWKEKSLYVERKAENMRGKSAKRSQTLGP